MNCPKCGTKMSLGKAIKPDIEAKVLYIAPKWNLAPQSMINADTLELINVLKCPACGHSDDGVEE